MTEATKPELERIADLEQRIAALEAEVKDKRATDAFLYLMTTTSAETLMGIMDGLKAAITNQPTHDLAENVRVQSAKYADSSKQAADLIWGTDNDKPA